MSFCTIDHTKIARHAHDMTSALQMAPTLITPPPLRILVQFDPNQFNRQPHENDEIEARIDEFWRKRQHENPHLFNGSKFRLAQAEQRVEDRVVILQLGLTDYKTYLGISSNPEPFIKHGVEKYDNPTRCLSRKLGVSGIVLSKDRMIVALRRSGRVGVYPGKID